MLLAAVVEQLAGTPPLQWTVAAALARRTHTGATIFAARGVAWVAAGKVPISSPQPSAVCSRSPTAAPSPQQNGAAPGRLPAAGQLLQQWARAAHSQSSGRGEVPKDGPRHDTLTAVPFGVPRDQADAAFNRYHSSHWGHNPALPRWARPAKEAYVPLWVGDARVAVEVTGAEVGRQELVTRMDPRTGRVGSVWDTVWRRVELRMAWESRYSPEDPAMQLYAAWKYPRADIEALRPGPLITSARAITPDMLKAAPGAPFDTRRVGAFTVTPDIARRLLASRVESAERRRAEEQVAGVTGYPEVRCVQMSITWIGPSGRDGPFLAPVYLPVYVYAWTQAGIKIRTFVSGVDGRAAGPHHLDQTKVATLATAATSAALLFTGAAAVMSPLQLLVAGVAVPYLASSLLARFWPAVRHLWSSISGRAEQAWHTRGASGETDWSADFTYSARRDQPPPGGGGGSAGGWDAGGGGAESFSDFARDPWAWLEREMRRQQQRAQRQQAQWEEAARQRGGYQGGGDQQWWQQQQQRQQQQQWGGPGRRGGAAAGPPGDPKGYYQRLGVSPGASPAEISEAFRGLALQHHPDRFQNAADKAAATKRFQEITEAYQTLRDKSKRAVYDSTGTA